MAAKELRFGGEARQRMLRGAATLAGTVKVDADTGLLEELVVIRGGI